jgi:hypothetical protein
MDPKKSGRTAKGDVRAATSARTTERREATTKRPSALPPPLAKKREKSIPPPMMAAPTKAASIAPLKAASIAPPVKTASIAPPVKTASIAPPVKTASIAPPVKTASIAPPVKTASIAPLKTNAMVPPARPSAPPIPAAAKTGQVSPAANDNDRNKRMIPPPIGRGRLPTGSLHTEAREPAQADQIKQKLTALVNVQQKLGELKRAANRNFYEIGALLHRVRAERLFEVKGYSSFEAFVERETSLGQQFCAQAVRIHQTFLPEAAHTLGFSRLCAALAVLEEEPSGMTAVDSLRGARPAIPPHKL